MVVVIRVDASESIGSGHVHRTLTLATMLQEKGHQVHFICRRLTGNLIKFVEDNGFSVVALEITEPSTEKTALAHADWLVVSQQVDALETSAVVKSLGAVDWLVVDHYALDVEWEEAVSQYVRRVFIIDDLADRSHSCDLLLDQNLHADPSKYRELCTDQRRLSRTLFGPMYALLRPEFYLHRQQALSRRKLMKQPKRILISMGGVDKENLTGFVVRSIGRLLNRGDIHLDIEVEVVMGHLSIHQAAVSQEIERLPCPYQLSVGVSNMAERMTAADIAVGTAGTTSWERAVLGLPAILFVMAENQRPIAESLQEVSAIDYAGEAGEVTEAAFQSALENILRNLIHYKTLVKGASELSDGKGCERVVSMMESISDAE